MLEPHAQADLRLTITEFERLTLPGRWARREICWQEWCEATVAAGAGVYLTKDAVPLIGMYSLRDGASRGREGVQYYSGLALDFDDVPFESVERTAAALDDLGVSYLWHTSWSHQLPGKGERRRLLVPLAEPLHPDAYRPTMFRLRDGIAPDLDVEALQTGQAFYLPATPPDMSDAVELFWQPGKGLDIGVLAPMQLAIVAPQVKPPPTPPKAVAVIDTEIWGRVAAKMIARSDPRQIALGQRLRAVCDGVRFAQQGERDQALWELCCLIVRTFPDVSSDSVSELFSLSLGRMATDDGADALTDVDLRDKLERARAQTFTATDARWHPERHEAIRQAFGGGRATPYTPEEVTEIREALGGVSEAALQRLWIMQSAREYYLVGPKGKLVRCQKEAFDNVARVVLSPAPIDLHKVDKGTRRQYSRAELLESYSTPLEGVGLSMIAQTPQIDLEARTLTLPACPMRQLPEVFDPQIDQWLQHLAGPLHDTLIQWLSHVPDLSRPLAALVLTGPKSVGKGMLALGISRLWTTEGPTQLAQAMSKYNIDLLRCPFCSADEGAIPRDFQGRERTEDLRSFIQEMIRPVDQKFKDLVQLRGATRLQISANNDDVLALGAGLAANDVDAIAARFLHVAASDTAREYLESIGGWEVTAKWVEGDGIAKHVKWLHKYLGAPWSGRFGVDIQQSLVDRMLVRTGVRSQLCELFVRGVKDRAPLGEGAQVLGGHLMVTLDWVIQAWTTFLRQSVKQPSTSALIKALDGLSSRVEIDGVGWFVVEPARLAAWGEEAGSGTAAKVAEWLAQHETTDA